MEEEPQRLLLLPTEFWRYLEEELGHQMLTLSQETQKGLFNMTRLIDHLRYLTPEAFQDFIAAVPNRLPAWDRTYAFAALVRLRPAVSAKSFEKIFEFVLTGPSDKPQDQRYLKINYRFDCNFETESLPYGNLRPKELTNDWYYMMLIQPLQACSNQKSDINWKCIGVINPMDVPKDMKGSNIMTRLWNDFGDSFFSKPLRDYILQYNGKYSKYLQKVWPGESWEMSQEHIFKKHLEDLREKQSLLQVQQSAVVSGPISSILDLSSDSDISQGSVITDSSWQI